MCGGGGGGEIGVELWTACNISFVKHYDMILFRINSLTFEKYVACFLAMLLHFLAMCGFFVAQASPFVDPLPSALSE